MNVKKVKSGVQISDSHIGLRIVFSSTLKGDIRKPRICLCDQIHHCGKKF